MALVDSGGCLLEAIPQVFAEFFGHGTGFAVFLMEFLQLVEGGNGVLDFGQLLGGFAEVGLDFQIFLEVIGAEFMIQSQLIVELFHVELVVFPQLGSSFSGHGLDFFPLSLQLFESVIVFVRFVGRDGHGLDLLDDVEFLLQIILLFLFSSLLCFGTEFADESHFGFENLLVFVGSGDEGFGVAAGSHKGIAGSHGPGVVQAVVGLLQGFHFAAGHVAAFGHDFLQPVDDALLCVGQLQRFGGCFAFGFRGFDDFRHFGVFRCLGFIGDFLRGGGAFLVGSGYYPGFSGYCFCFGGCFGACVFLCVDEGHGGALVVINDFLCVGNRLRFGSCGDGGRFGGLVLYFFHVGYFVFFHDALIAIYKGIARLLVGLFACK